MCRSKNYFYFPLPSDYAGRFHLPPAPELSHRRGSELSRRWGQELSRHQEQESPSQG